jgi:hypothetical protein
MSEKFAETSHQKKSTGPASAWAAILLLHFLNSEKVSAEFDEYRKKDWQMLMWRNWYCPQLLFLLGLERKGTAEQAGEPRLRAVSERQGHLS